MGTPREDLRDTAATAVLEVAKNFGDRIIYTQRGRSFNLYAIIDAESMTDEDLLGTKSARTKRTYWIPRQIVVDEDGDNIVVPDDIFIFEKGDIIRFDNANWVVESWNADSLRAQYEVETIRTHPRRVS